MHTSVKPIAMSCAIADLSPEPLRSDAELNPLVVEIVDIVLAALEPTSPAKLPNNSYHFLNENLFII